jgi:hypothetical protein
MKSDEQVILDMLGEYQPNEAPTVRPEPFQPLAPWLARTSMMIPRPTPRRASLIGEVWGIVRKVFDTVPPPIHYEDQVVASWTK